MNYKPAPQDPMVARYQRIVSVLPACLAAAPNILMHYGEHHSTVKAYRSLLVSEAMELAVELAEALDTFETDTTNQLRESLEEHRKN